MTAARSLRALPKAHLHIHLEAGMRPSTLAELAAGYDVPVPVVGAYADFTAFEAVYGAAFDVLRSEADVRRLVREALEDARADGAGYFEPALYLPAYRQRFGPDAVVLEIVLDELRVSGAALGVATGVLVAADRTTPVSEADALAALAVRYAGQGVVSFGLAGDERNWPPEPFADAFAVARDAGLLSVPHTGELEGPASIRGALEALRPDRIQHGVRAIEDPALVARLAEAQVCLDVCPTSNLVLGVVDRIEDHPLPPLMAAGIPCTINADDPLLFGPGLLDEYSLCRDALGLSDAELAEAARASFRFSGAPPAVVAEGLRAIDAWLAEPAAAPGPAR